MVGFFFKLGLRDAAKKKIDPNKKTNCVKIGCFQWPFSHNLALWQEHIFKFSQRTINKFLIWVILGPIPIKNEWVIVTTQLQLQFTLSWCGLKLLLHNKSPHAQPPPTLNSKYCVNDWIKILWLKDLFLGFFLNLYINTF